MPEERPLISDTIHTTICYNQLPYQWNGLTCLTAGIYTANITGPDGGISTMVLHLEVTNVGTSITNAITCTNQLPFSWNEHSYSTSGTYSVTLTSAGGCDSVPILSLTVNNVVTSNTLVNVCSNQLPYQWNGNSYAAPGNYAAVLTSAAGCDSVASLQLRIKPVTGSTTNRSICANQLPYFWNGNSYPATGTYSVTLQGSNGCDSVATLNLSLHQPVTSVTRVTVCSTQLPYFWNGYQYSAAGTYSVTLTGSNGCDSIASLVITVPIVPSSLTYATLCTGQMPYSWNGNIYTAPGIYSITLTGSSGCDSIARLRITVAPVLTSITMRTVCNSQLPISWSGQTCTGAGTYTASFVNAAGCDSVATLILTVDTPSVGTTTVIVCENQLPYTWNGQIFTAIGTYPLNPPVVTGPCNSVDTLELILKVIVPSHTNISVCRDQLPYNWNGNSYPATGDYAVTLTTASGCDSVANLHLTIQPVATSIIHVALCHFQVPYSWNGNLYNSSGTYNINLTASNGCDSVATLSLVVNQPAHGVTNISVCPSQLPYTWNGHQYSSSGAYTLVLTSISGCDSVVTLNLQVSPFLSNTTNITICQSQLPYAWNGHVYTSAGIYTVHYTGSAGCDSLATLNLTVNPYLASQTDLHICGAALPYHWNNQTLSAPGTYTVTLPGSGGCDSVATLHLFVHQFVTGTANVTICNNQLPYSWNGNSYPVAGDYPVTLTGSNGCDSIVTLHLVVTDVLTSTTNTSICTGQLPYSWNGNSYTSGGTYSVTMTTPGGCDSVPILSLTVLPYVTSVTSVSVCENEMPYYWNNTIYPSAGSYTVMLNNTRGCDSLITFNLSVIPVETSTDSIEICESLLPFNWNGNNYTAAGNYSLTLTGSSGCDSIAVLHLSVIPAAPGSTSVSVCSNQLPFAWNGNSYTAGGSYPVTLTSGTGCDSLATLHLTVNDIALTTVSLTICHNQLPYNWNGQACAAAGTYSSTFTGSNGCDSVVTLNLSVSSTVTGYTVISVCADQLPYMWNGNAYQSGGTYSITLTGSGGCDSVAVLQLTVNNASASTTDVTVCSSALPYTWNGNQYTGSGTYTAELMNASGCDSTAVLHLIVNDATTGSEQAIICQSAAPYHWNGQQYASSGIYSITLTGTNGCDSLVTLHLTVNTPSASSTSTGICSNQLPYNWNGQQYTASGTYTALLSNANGCDSVATLVLTVWQATTTNVHAQTCSYQLPYYWNGHAYTSSGIYPLLLTGSNGCDSVVTLNLTVHQAENSTTGVTICSNQLPYVWNGQSFDQAGTYSQTFTGAAGCDSVAALHLIVHPVKYSSLQAAVCSSLLPYNWNGYMIHTSGVHSVTLTSADGCDSIVTLHLTINPTPAPPVVQTPVTYCQFDQPLSLSAAGSNQLYWYNAATGAAGNTTAPVPSTSSAGSTLFYVSQSTAFCESPRVPITVTVNAKPHIGPDKNIKTCFGGYLKLDTVYYTAGNSSTWTLNLQPVPRTDSVTASGFYQLISVTPAGCADTARVRFTVQPPVVANAGPDGTAEYLYPYQLNGSGNGSYQWSPGYPLLNHPGIANPLATLKEDTRFVLQVRDAIGCTSYDTVKIKVLKGPGFYIPNAFTPNSDGLNDVFRPTPVGILHLSYFRVFNRFGELMFETSETGKGWNGMYKGIKQEPGNYVWMLKGTDRKHETIVMKGNVVLVR